MVARRDNFGVLRLAAATAVLVSHAFRLTGATEPVAAVTGETLGDVAVAVFFAVSGFLVAGSWCRDPRVWRFLAKRARRIWPGLAVAVLFAVYVVGPLFTRLAPADYLASGSTRAYLMAKLTLVGGTTELPGLFHANPYPEVNGSLWTLPVEVKAYLCLAALALLGAFRRRWLLPAAWAAATGAAVLFRVDVGSILSPGAVLRATDIVSPSSLASRAVYLGAVFLGGALLYSRRDRIPLRWSVAGLLFAAWLAARGSPAQWAIGAAGFPYACLCVAYRTRPVLNAFVARTDLSYGIYLYSYPVEQVIRALVGPVGGPALMTALALPVSAGLAYASWHLVERPCLHGWRRAPRLAPAASDA